MLLLLLLLSLPAADRTEYVCVVWSGIRAVRMTLHDCGMGKIERDPCARGPCTRCRCAPGNINLHSSAYGIYVLLLEDGSDALDVRNAAQMSQHLKNDVLRPPRRARSGTLAVRARKVNDHLCDHKARIVAVRALTCLE